MNIDISVIIPVYNTEKYIADALNSVFDQNINNLQVIVVDDGSTDNSVNIIKKFQDKYENIELYQQENSGPAVARNFAIRKASGKYIMFMDSDDLLPNNALMSLYEEIEANQSQVAVGMIKSFNRTKEWMHNTMLYFKDMRKSNTNLNELPELINNMSPCNKMYSRKFIEENNLKFLEEVHIREDIYFVSNVFFKAERVSVIPNMVYLYRGRDEAGTSLTSKVNEKVFNDIICVSDSLDFDQNQSQYSDNATIKNYRYENELNALTYRLYPFVQEHKVDNKFYINIQNFLKKIGNSVISSIGRGRELVLYKIKAGNFIVAKQLIDNEKPRKLSIMFRIKRKLIRNFKNLFWKVSNNVLPKLKYVVNTPDNLWLIGEQHGAGIRDTGYMFFLYCRENFPERNIYFVTKKENITNDLKEKSHIVAHGSLKNYLFAISAEVYAYADSYKDIFPYWSRIKNKSSLKVAIFLQHGIISTNKAKYYHSSRVKKRDEMMDIFVVSSNKEKKYISKEYAYNEDVFITSGLSRFDRLYENKDKSMDKQILFIPTWRNQLRNVDDDIYLDSVFHNKILEFLNSSSLDNMLKKYGYTLQVCFHHASTKFTKHYSSSSSIVFSDMGSIDMYDMLINSRMLITDYSSVAFDMAFLNRPVAFYQFDAEEYFKHIGGENIVDFKTELFGCVSDNCEDIIKNIESNMLNDFKVIEEYKNRADIFFKYRDNNHCKRIFKAIEKKLTIKSR